MHQKFPLLLLLLLLVLYYYYFEKTDIFIQLRYSHVCEKIRQNTGFKIYLNVSRMLKDKKKVYSSVLETCMY